MDELYVGDIYQHRKHNPPEYWHEYQVIEINQGGQGRFNIQRDFLCRDAETCEIWHIAESDAGNTCLYQLKGDTVIYKDGPVVLYRSTDDDNAMPWVRPLHEFMDGRFTEVNP